VTAFSSQFVDSRWGVDQILGQPNVYPKYGDLEGAWTHFAKNSGIEYLELNFATSVVVSAVEVYETFGAGSCVKIQLRDPSGELDTVWQGPKTSQSSFTTARIFAPELQLRAYSTRTIRLEIDKTGNADWYEIDAVKLIKTECTACEAGKYKALTGSATCTDCGAGTYSTAVGASASSTCSACPSNSSSPAGSAALTNCT
jgi:hypothetical protein